MAKSKWSTKQVPPKPLPETYALYDITLASGISKISLSVQAPGPISALEVALTSWHQDFPANNPTDIQIVWRGRPLVYGQP